jgi:hypothetical protein
VFDNRWTVETFKIPIGHPNQGWSWGTFSAEPGRLTLDAIGGRRLVSQTRGSVTVVTARLAAAPWRTAVILKGDLVAGDRLRAYAVAPYSSGQTRRVREAIEQAGFDTVERATRFWRLPRSCF